MKNTDIMIHKQGNELLADSRDVARFFGVQHENLRDLIEKNLTHFEAIGILRFETGEIKGRGQPEKFCYLTEEQVAFLLTLTRNTGRTTELKLSLIQQFAKVRRQLRPVDSVLLSLPNAWRKVFPDDFYAALLRLHGHEFDRAEGTHSWVGGFTNKYIYQPLWDGLSLELKTKRSQRIVDGDSDVVCLKLHQFLEANARAALERHVAQVTVLLKAAYSPEHFRELFASVFCGATQGILQLSPIRRSSAAK